MRLLAAIGRTVMGAVALASIQRASGQSARDESIPGFAAFEVGSGRTTSQGKHFEAAAFTLREHESPHAEFPATFALELWADLKIVRGGNYRFALDVEGGDARIEVTPPGRAAVSLLRPRGAASDAASRVTPWIELAPGTVALRVSFARTAASAARLRTMWELESKEGRPGFAEEPIPHSAVRVPAEQVAAVTKDLAARRGRVLLTELGCANCHDAGKAESLVPKRARHSLARVAVRAGDEWLQRWVLDPQTLNPGSGMPDLFGDTPEELADASAALQFAHALVRDEAGRLEGAAAGDSAASGGAAGSDPSRAAGGGANDAAGGTASRGAAGGSVGDPTSEDSAAAAAASASLAVRGRELFHEIGCIACHGPLESPAAAYGDEHLDPKLPSHPPLVPFGDLTGKWRAGELASFLADPRSIRAHGRMPSFGLDGNEANALAQYLVQRWQPAPPQAEVVALDPAAMRRGPMAFVRKGCFRCHTIGESDDKVPEMGAGRPLAQLDPVRGCLAADASTRGAAPRYELEESVRADLRAGLESVRRASGAASPLDATQHLLAAFRCGACHERRGEGGLEDALLAWCRTRVEADLGDEGRLPPRLDSVGFRLQSPWLQQVVSDGTRARPYLALRMPRFGAELGERCASGFAALEGEWRSDDPRAAPAAPPGTHSSEELAAAGRALAGSGGLSCITCHSFGNRPSAGTPGLDFRQFATRLRREGWRRYALAPLRFKPGTRMPTYFEDGKSAALSILDGDATLQIEALWEWFERAEQMPAPEGVPSGQKMVLDVGARPKVFRTFLERAGNRGIAIGTPDGLHFAFDAEQIRLTEAWTGEFLDVAPVWTGRGGNVAPQLGPIVWSAAPGPALLLTPPASGWPSDSGRAHGLKFRGYRLEQDGTPVFQWELRQADVPADEPPRPDAVQVEERFVPDPRPEVLFTRTFTIRGLTRARPVLMQLDDKSRVVRVANGEVETSKGAGEGRPTGVDFVSVLDPAQPCVVEIEVLP